MPTHEIGNVSKMTFYDTETGREIEFNSSIITSIEANAEYDNHLDFDPFKCEEISMDIDISHIDDKLIDELTGKNKQMKIGRAELVQNKKHKKKRINKKWAKKYGYSLILYTKWV